MAKLIKGVNDLLTVNPELAKEWNYKKNGDLKPEDVTANSGKKVWWLYPYDDSVTGKYFDFEWQAIIYNRNKGIGCPYLSKKALWSSFNDLTTINPELAKQWHPTKNGNLKPTDVTANSHLKVWWLLPYDDPITNKHFDFEWQEQVSNRSNGNGCPYLSGKAVWIGFNDLATVNPELAKQWHPTKNGNLKPTDVVAGSEKKVWWLLPYDDSVTGKHFDFEWQATIINRHKGNNCPFLPTASSPQVWCGFNDLATTNPELAKEWHPTKNGKLKPTDVCANSTKKVWWLLSYDNPVTGKHFDFEWLNTIHNRNNGSGCPYLTSSKTENLVYNLLTSKNIFFKAEESFDNCKDKKVLPFDVYLPNKNIIIECDGMQHFKAKKDFFGGKEGLKTNKKHDRIKNNFCKENNIPILRIPYNYDPIVDKNKIESLVLDFIKTKQVPQEILDIYSQYKFSNYVECAMELNKRFSKRVA